MPLNFPSTPTDGQIYTANGQAWKYNSTLAKWIAQRFMPVAVSATAPAGQEGQLWFDSNDGTLMIYYGSTWVQVSGFTLPSDVLVTDDIGSSVQPFHEGTLRASDLDVTVGKNATLGTAIATTSGTSHQFTGLPSGITRIDMSIVGVSTNGTSQVQVQIGDATTGGYITTGYVGSQNQSGAANSTASITTGFCWRAGAAAGVRHGVMTLELVDSSTNQWMAYGVHGQSNGAFTGNCYGVVTLAGELDRIRLTTINGTDTFDAGSVNIRYS